MEPEQIDTQQDTGIGIAFFGVLLGLLIGAILGLWFAPESGKDMRHRIEGDSLNDLVEQGKIEARRYQESNPQ